MIVSLSLSPPTVFYGCFLVPIEHLFGTFFAQSRAQLGAAIARGMALRAFGTSSMGRGSKPHYGSAFLGRARPMVLCSCHLRRVYLAVICVSTLIALSTK
jgi:hypothetical protein